MTNFRSTFLLVSTIALVQLLGSRVAAQAGGCGGEGQPECAANYGAGNTAQQPKKKLIPNEWGEAQIVLEIPGSDKVEEIINKTHEYMTKKVLVEAEFDEVRERCKNLDGYCSHWAAEGHCDSDENGRFMIQSCGPACLSCDLVAPMVDAEVQNAHAPGSSTGGKKKKASGAAL